MTDQAIAVTPESGYPDAKPVSLHSFFNCLKDFRIRAEAEARRSLGQRSVGNQRSKQNYLLIRQHRLFTHSWKSPRHGDPGSRLHFAKLLPA